jgi:hypothetical protein
VVQNVIVLQHLLVHSTVLQCATSSICLQKMAAEQLGLFLFSRSWQKIFAASFARAMRRVARMAGIPLYLTFVQRNQS